MTTFARDGDRHRVCVSGRGSMWLRPLFFQNDAPLTKAVALFWGNRLIYANLWIYNSDPLGAWLQCKGHHGPAALSCHYPALMQFWRRRLAHGGFAYPCNHLHLIASALTRR